MAKGKGIKSGYVDLPTTKVRNWAEHGKTSEEIAKLCGITVDELFERLGQLALRNRKSASSIRGLIERNDDAAKQSRSRGAALRKTAAKMQAQSAPGPLATTPAPPATVPENPQKGTPTTEQQPAHSEADELKDQIARFELKLDAISRQQESASQTIAESKARALEYEKVLKDILAQLESNKAAYEAEIESIRQAEDHLVACEGQRINVESKLAEMRAKLDTLCKPEIWVYQNGEISTENADIPEDIDTSGWAQLITTLPTEIGEELRKKDAETLLRLKVIVAQITRPDMDLVIEDETLQKAWAAMCSHN